MTKSPDSRRREDETQLNRSASSIEEVRGIPSLSWRDANGDHVVRVEKRMTIGSAHANGVVIADPTVSRLHAEVDFRGDALWVRDLGSRNHTYVEGVMIESARIPATGARLQLGSTRMRAEFVQTKTLVDVWPHGEFGPLVCESRVMRQLFASLARVARTDSSVLINGETGTGKEVVARAIHDASPRAGGPFIVVDCGALPETLLDAELFGHAKGAFTGAIGARGGAIEAAEGGTVFLDEIGELHLSMQPKLLRVLESRTVRRLGESSHRKVNVRFLSATHRDLLKMTSEGGFREDLYFRLAVVPLHLPPLRERLDDIEPLIARFLPNGAPLPPELVREMRARPWRGNVRELRNFVERVEALGGSEALKLMQSSAESTTTAAAAPAAPAASSGDSDAPSQAVDGDLQSLVSTRVKQAYSTFRQEWIDIGERAYVKALLERHDGNVANAAQEAGLDRTYLYRLIRKHAR